MNWKPLDEDARPVLGAANDWLDGFGLEGIHGGDIVFCRIPGGHLFSWDSSDAKRHIVEVVWHTCCSEHPVKIECVNLRKDRK